jgi:hypothetical protein
LDPAEVKGPTLFAATRRGRGNAVNYDSVHKYCAKPLEIATTAPDQLAMNLADPWLTDRQAFSCFPLGKAPPIEQDEHPEHQPR